MICKMGYFNDNNNNLYLFYVKIWLQRLYTDIREGTLNKLSNRLKGDLKKNRFKSKVPSELKL